MLPRLACLFTFIISFLILENQKISSYKTLEDFKKQMKKVEKEDMTTSDVLVGKAMDFIYSNKTMMNLIARELWNVGSTAVDRIVKMKEIQDKKLQERMQDNTY